MASPMASAQNCPSGIPEANNPSCLPPSDAASPYYVAPARPMPPPQPSGYWIDQWGAIVTDAVSGDVGTAIKKSTAREALDEAFAQCRSGGGSACKKLIVFEDQCGALAWATGGGKAAAAGGSTPEMAEQSAMATCAATGKGCKIFYSECALPVFHAY
ncbi:DUF4189 domain-containing protein [Lysobacter sp. HA18]